MNPTTCIRCEKATPEFGRWLCPDCIKALDALPPGPPPPDQGKPTSRRIKAKSPAFNMQPTYSRKS